jgi:hypothetical protein
LTISLHNFIPCASQLQILNLKFFLVDKLSKAWSRSMPNLWIFITGIRIFLLT